MDSLKLALTGLSECLKYKFLFKLGLIFGLFFNIKRFEFVLFYAILLIRNKKPTESLLFIAAHALHEAVYLKNLIQRALF